MGSGARVLRIDLSHVQRMNSGLLATILLLVRESARAGRRLYLVGASDEFRNWARTFSLLETLESRGLIARQPSGGALSAAV
jgi:ABC-type transporter Mla MlaB component